MPKFQFEIALPITVTAETREQARAAAREMKESARDWIGDANHWPADKITVGRGNLTPISRKY